MKKEYKLQEKNDSDSFELTLLTTANNDHELNLMKNLLEEHDIAYMIKDYGTGGYMRIITGSSLYGTDILVEKSEFEKAKAILDEFTWNE